MIVRGARDDRRREKERGWRGWDTEFEGRWLKAVWSSFSRWRVKQNSSDDAATILAILTLLILPELGPLKPALGLVREGNG